MKGSRGIGGLIERDMERRAMLGPDKALPTSRGKR